MHQLYPPSSSHAALTLAQSKAGKILTSDTQAKKEVHMPKLHHKNENNTNGLRQRFSTKPTIPTKMFDENYIDKPQDTVFKGTIMNFITEF